MLPINPGYEYELTNFDNGETQTILFINKRRVEGSDALETVHDGTTVEEVMEMLLHRISFLNNKLPSRETSLAIDHIESALLWLNRRTQLRRVVKL